MPPPEAPTLAQSVDFAGDQNFSHSTLLVVAELGNFRALLNAGQEKFLAYS